MKKGFKYESNANAKLFITTFREKTNSYFTHKQQSKYANGLVVFKTIFFLSLFFLSYLLLISNKFSPSTTLLLAIICGVSSILIVFNISHDASHNALFKNKRLNKILSYTFNLVGGSGYMWNITHDKIHHTYPNIINIDPDLDQSRPFLRVTPGMVRLKFHRYQHYYAPILYSTYMLYLVFIKDFQDLNIIPTKNSPLLQISHHWKEYFILIGSKIIYISYALILPITLLDIVWWHIILGYLFVSLLMSLLLLGVQLPLHVNSEATFAMVKKDGNIHKNWVIHTLENTTDYHAQNKIANFFFGGLNAHSIHHLCSGICHVHYPELSRILKDTAKEFGIIYHNVSMWEALKSHFNLLKKLGKA